MDNRDFAARYGPWALVAGCSRGLGAAFADELARRGLNLALLARQADPLEEQAAALRRRHGVDVRCLGLDLADPRFPAILQRELACVAGPVRTPSCCPGALLCP